MSAADENIHLATWDYVVFAAVLAVSAGIGIFYGCTGGKQRTVSEFLLADRSMSILPVSMSLLASFMSAITLLGTPAEIYRYGTQYWLIWVGYVMLIPLAAHVTVPIFFNLKVTSVFEYLELRFCRGMRLCGVIAYIIQTTLYMAMVLYAPSLALNAVTGLNVWASVFSVGLVCTFYTTLGGMKAVMWTDAFQITMMFIGLLAVLIKGSIDNEGFINMWQDLKDGDRVEFSIMDPNPTIRHSFWSVIFGGCFTWLAIYGVNQAQVQRAIAVPTLRQAQIALWLNVPGLTALLTICAMTGMVVYSEYKHCDPLTRKRITSADQLLPLLVMDKLGHLTGLPGLFTASLFSAALSTLSSGLNSLSAVTLTDIVRLFCFKNLSESRATLASKILAIIYGLICIALTFLAANLGGILQAALGLFGMIGGPTLGIFWLGMLFPWANKWGAYAGFFSALLLTLWIGIGAQVYKPYVPLKPMSVNGCAALNYSDMIDSTEMSTSFFTDWTTEAMPVVAPSDQAGYLKVYELSYIWYAAFAMLVVTVVGLIVSFITGPNRPKDVDPRLLCPIFDTFCCCLPERLRRWLRCYVDYSKRDDQEKPLDDDNTSDPEMKNGYVNPVIGNDVKDIDEKPGYRYYDQEDTEKPVIVESSHL